MNFKNKEKIFIKRALLVAVLVLIIINFTTVIGAIKKIYNIIFPLILGFIIAYILNIIVNILEKYYPKTDNKYLAKLKKPICLLLSFIIITLVIILVVNLVVPQVVETISELFDTLPTYIDKIIDWAKKYEDTFPALKSFINKNNLNNLNKDKIVDNVVGYIKENWGGIVSSSISIISNISSGLINLFISLFFSIYLLANKETILKQLERVQLAFMEKEKIEKVNKVLSITNQTFSSFIIGQFTEAIVLGSLCTLGMLVFRFPYASSVGVFVGVTSLIPIIGAFIGGAVGILLILAVDPIKALFFVIFLLVLQQLEGNLIYPKVVGSSIGLPGIWVFAAVTIGGGLGGIVGMMVSVPTFATIYKLLRIETQERLENEIF